MDRRPRHAISCILQLVSSIGLFLLAAIAHADDTPRQIIVKAILEEDADKKAALIDSLSGKSDPIIKTLLTDWKEDTIYLYKIDDDHKVPILLTGEKDADGNQSAVRVEDGQPLMDKDGKPARVAAADMDTAEHDSVLRTHMKSVLDLQELAAPDPELRIQAITTFGMSQEPDKLPVLRAMQKDEKNGNVQHALQEAIALIQLKNEDPKVQIAAVKELADLGSIRSRDFLTQLRVDAKDNPDIAKAVQAALTSIAGHIRTVNSVAAVFHGLSTGSILLVASIGLAITFGLMGVINMAHGELIAVGAYTTYVVQNVFGSGLELSPFGHRLAIPGLNLGGAAYDSYFLTSIPLSFLVAALVGILLERGIIRFLYRRPLESLLATWGVSLVLQQLFRLVFGANNVQVYSPHYLSSHWTFFDIEFEWNRIFVICFAVVIVLGTHLILTRTSLGLLIRAVTQNRIMAACMGVKTERVNMLTFAFGSGLAGLAGAFLSQIGNVGPSLGQSYIIDAFMTVVVGGVGKLLGTVISALGIGVSDQSLQQILDNPVLGKILVLVGIILFLQWRPAGIFVTKSRSLES
ncbi:MAG TPA: urea ABC transporter permease subunit UrtB [Chthoniobacter sp.]|jgi:urea transport system permease protein